MRKKKVVYVAAATVSVVVSSLVGAGMYSVFTEQETHGAVTEVGDYNLGLTVDGSATTQPISFSNVVPGEKNFTTFTLVNDGDIQFNNIKMYSSVNSTASPAQTDPGPPSVTYGGTNLMGGATPMIYGVKACNEPWVNVVKNGNPTCSSGERVVVADRSISNVNDVVISGSDLKGKRELFGAPQQPESLYLLASYVMPDNANMNVYQGASASFGYRFVASQRDAVTETR